MEGLKGSTADLEQMADLPQEPPRAGEDDLGSDRLGDLIRGDLTFSVLDPDVVAPMIGPRFHNPLQPLQGAPDVLSSEGTEEPRHPKLRPPSPLPR